MEIWRYRRGWTERELEQALSHARGFGLNFPASPDQMTVEQGWNHVESQAVIGREPPGPPLADGAFARARRGLELLEFSDPRVVVAHFREGEPVAGRIVLLELQAMGLRFLCPVRIGQVRDEADEWTTRFGFCFETLDGHIEAGREWFLVTKQHETGEVRFRIEADWRAGEFPTWWSYLGFQLFGRRYQRAWHLEAHKRFRALVRSEADAPTATRGRTLTHTGHVMDPWPIQFRSLRGVQKEELRQDRLLRVGALGAACGLRTFTPPAVLALRLHHLHTMGEAPHDLLSHALVSRPGVGLLTAMALGEWAGDKLPFIPNRTSPPALLGRVGMGAAVGYLLSRHRQRRRMTSVAVGAVCAAAGTFVGFGLRKLLSRHVVREPWAGVVEDVFTLGLSAFVARGLRPPRGEAPPRRALPAGALQQDALQGA